MGWLSDPKCPVRLSLVPVAWTTSSLWVTPDVADAYNAAAAGRYADTTSSAQTTGRH